MVLGKIFKKIYVCWLLKKYKFGSWKNIIKIGMKKIHKIFLKKYFWKIQVWALKNIHVCFLENIFFLNCLEKYFLKYIYWKHQNLNKKLKSKIFKKYRKKIHIWLPWYDIAKKSSFGALKNKFQNIFLKSTSNWHLKIILKKSRF